MNMKLEVRRIYWHITYLLGIGTFYRSIFDLLNLEKREKIISMRQKSLLLYPGCSEKKLENIKSCYRIVWFRVSG